MLSSSRIAGFRDKAGENCLSEQIALRPLCIMMRTYQDPPSTLKIGVDGPKLRAFRV